MTEEIQIMQSTEIVQDANFNSMVEFAQRHPRNLMKVVENAIFVATMDDKTAETCNYTVPRGGKNLNGPSVHLARIIVQQYKNMRVESRVLRHDNKQVYAEAICFDVENNTAVRSEVTKSIVGSLGKIYSNDMIITTGKAAAAIAYRNAVFDVVPKSIVDKVYQATKDLLTGNLKDETKLATARLKAIKSFKDDFDVAESELLKSLGLNSVKQIKQEEVIVLRGMYRSLLDNVTTVAEMFGRLTDKEKDLKNPVINTPENIVTKPEKDLKPNDIFETAPKPENNGK
jgi:hypothetical protein